MVVEFGGGKIFRNSVAIFRGHGRQQNKSKYIFKLTTKPAIWGYIIRIFHLLWSYHTKTRFGKNCNAVADVFCNLVSHIMKVTFLKYVWNRLRAIAAILEQIGWRDQYVHTISPFIIQTLIKNIRSIPISSKNFLISVEIVALNPNHKPYTS